MAEERVMRADARRNREAILVAARAAFEADEQLRFDDFAERAGVGVGTLYRHFPTREALGIAVYEGEVAALCDQARDPGHPPGEALASFLRSFVSSVTERAPLARALASLVDIDTQAAGGERLERALGDLLEQAARDGAVDASVTAGSLLVALHGIGAANARPNWAQESRDLIEVLIRGLAAH